MLIAPVVHGAEVLAERGLCCGCSLRMSFKFLCLAVQGATIPTAAGSSRTCGTCPRRQPIRAASRPQRAQRRIRNPIQHSGQHAYKSNSLLRVGDDDLKELLTVLSLAECPPGRARAADAYWVAVCSGIPMRSVCCCCCAH